MKVSDTFYNIRCDSCGAELCEEWYRDAGNDEFAAILSESGWFAAEHDHHYCPDCWGHDDDDNIVTKDGRKWTDYDHKEIRQHRMNYLSLSEGMTLTQMRTELLAERKGTPEWEVYRTFDSHGIFERFRDEMYERMYNRKLNKH